jgi:alpha-L-fucosidase
VRKTFGDGRDWFNQKRFGMFVHWGLYAIPGWHEQHQWRGRVDRDEYGKLVGQWNPVKFDPDAWLDVAESAGMEYLVVTAKHHDGFCLFETKETSFNTVNSPYGKDLMAELAEACARRKFTLGFYYSCADWHHPNYPNQGRHHELDPQAGDDPDLEKYLVFLRAQVRELCTQYGDLGSFWWDMNVDEHVDPSINDMIRQLQPNAVINNRGYDDGDFGTPERDHNPELNKELGFANLTEACQSVGKESWGYRENEDYYTDRHLIRSIDRYLARDSNYLLNIGPKADGSIAEQAVDVLGRIGAWYQQVRESFRDVEPVSSMTSNRDELLTSRGNEMYIHLVGDPTTNGVHLPPISESPISAVLLNTGQDVKHSVDLVPSNHVKRNPYLRLNGLPANDLANTVMVVKLTFEVDVASFTSVEPSAGTVDIREK